MPYPTRSKTLAFRLALSALLGVSLVWTSRAPAQGYSDAPSVFLDPSIAALGMGHAGSAVFWTEFPNAWANPALLGYHRGVHYSHGSIQIVPDYFDDVYFRSDEITIGGGGVGIYTAGKPVEAIGRLKLDYGESEATDPDGNPIGTFHSYERTDQFGIGVNVLEAWGTFQRLRGREAPGLARFVDLSLGYAWKNVTVDLAPALIVLDGDTSHAETTQRDRGLLLRVTPLDQVSRHALTEGPDLRWRIDASAAYSQRNVANQDLGADPALAIYEQRLMGGSARATLGFRTGSAGGVWDFLEPTVALAVVFESSRYYYQGHEYEPDAETKSGQELALFDALYARHGYIDMGEYGIKDHTYGAGVRLRYRKMVGFTYDWARVPQAVFLDQVDRHAVTFFVDPIRLARTLK